MVNIDPDSSAVSPKRPFSAISKNPRRCLPSQSKSLPRSKRVKIGHITSNSSQDQSTQERTPEATNLPLEKSQESSSDQSATKWFDRVNENVKQTTKYTSKHEDESPFFLAREFTYNHPGGLRSTNGESFGGPRQRVDTENDDLRGVIDDLTVENKKLKHLLKTSQSRGKPSKPNPDKVLEIRMHGLPSDKKRELEQLLKTFTLGLHASTPPQPSSSPAFKAKTQSASKSSSQRYLPLQDQSAGDSGYASIAASGLNSTSQSGGNRSQEAVSRSNKEKNIKDYLHDIPTSLLPHGPTTMDEKSKMVLVVQRLEQLFTGKSAVPGEHSLPIQQQKISRSAARADRRDDMKNNRETKEEGIREAHMLPQDTKINLDAFEQDQEESKVKYRLDSGLNSDAPRPGLGETSSPDQRPTRPLDLDIHRAQVVEDNIQYLRHLGLSSPEFDNEPQKKDQPWMYLNLLISMAQLHTLNVTPAFIRKAVKKFSTRFELSKDEHKIRWKGAAEPMSLAIPLQSPSFATQRLPEDGGDDNGRRSRRSAASTSNEQASVSVSEGKAGQSSDSKNVHSTSTSTNLLTGLSRDRSKSSIFDYKPIVYRGKRLQLKPSYHDNSSSPGSISPESIGLVPAPTRSSLETKDYREGLVTFFSNPYYYADLSGDVAPVNMNPGLYSWSVQVLGVLGPQDHNRDTLRDAQACYFTAFKDPIKADWGANCPDLSMPNYLISQAGEYETEPLELPASGIGGVRPEENFALDVKIERSVKRHPGAPEVAMTNLSQNNRLQMKFEYHIVGCEKLELQPSRLPPPSYVFLTSSTSSSASRGYGDEDDSSSSSSHGDSPAPADVMWQWTSSSQDNLVDEDAESVASSSLGALEGARARLNSSRMVPEHNGEYVVNPAGRAVSGSLAATVGASWSAASVIDHDENRMVEMAASGMEID